MEYMLEELNTRCDVLAAMAETDDGLSTPVSGDIIRTHKFVETRTRKHPFHWETLWAFQNATEAALFVHIKNKLAGWKKYRVQP